MQQLPFEISGAQKRDWIQELSPFRADQSLNHFTGKLFGDSEILLLAHAFQAATDHQLKHPPL